jgi:hypothetical protein
MPPSVMSSPLRIELRHSLALRATLVLLAVLAAVALSISASPPWLLAVPPLLLALAWPRRQAGSPELLVLRGDGTAVELVGDEERIVVPLRLQRRGVLTVLTLAHDDEERSIVFLPDTLAAESRRQLALWFGRHVSSGDPTSPVAHV